MKDYSNEQKKQLRDRIVAMQEASGLSANAFATQKLGFSNGSKFSHVRNNFDQPGMVGNDTWEVIEKYITKTESYKLIVTNNLKKVWTNCERAYMLKKAIPVIGDGGYGKTTSLESFQVYNQKNKRYEVIVFDASKTKTGRQLITGLLEAFDVNKSGNIAQQLEYLRQAAMKRDFLLAIDEASSLKGYHVTVLKDVVNILKDICGIVVTGTPYFWNNLVNGAQKNHHLFSETKDRFFMHPEILDQPLSEEALAIFRANGITDDETLDIVMGREKRFQSHSWLVKKTFRGIADCIDAVRMAELPAINFETIEL